MVERGYLESDNKRRWANYHIKGKKVATSEQKVDTSEQKVDTSKTKKNLRKKDLEEEILKLCNNRFRKKDELASLLGKSENYLKDKFIYRMQREGKLEPYFPLTPNHPEQAYKTTEIYTKKNY